MLKINIVILVKIANIKFCLIIFLVYLEIVMANGIFDKSSFIITTSLASIAASDPIPPIEIPKSALFKTGASFIPSPTKASIVFSFFIFS